MKSACLILLALPLFGKSQQSFPPLFTQVPPEKSGIRFQNRIVESPDQNVLAYEYFYNGGGVAAGAPHNDSVAGLGALAQIGRRQSQQRRSAGFRVYGQ